MATYGNTPSEYPYNPQKRRKQKYSLFTRVVDFSHLPVTAGDWRSDGKTTTAWAAGDILQTLQIRPKQTVLGVQVEILTKSQDSGDTIDIGYGSDTGRWGRYNLNGSVGVKNTYTNASQLPDIFTEPLYFASADTIDIKINKAALQGKIRLIVHLLEDDR
jgi:hypothetical protein